MTRRRLPATKGRRPSCKPAARRAEPLAERYRRYQRDPVAFAEEVLRVKLWSRQRDILRSVFQNRRTVVPSGHGVGKTFVSAVAVLAFLYLRKPSKVITTAPTWLQVRRLLWSEINTLFKARLAPQWFPGRLLLSQLRVRDDWFALGVSPREGVSFQGYHQEHVLVVVDEAPGIRRDVFEGAESLMSGGDAHFLMIGNPIVQGGHFYDACRSSAWTVVRTSCLDSPNLTGEVVPPALLRRLVTRSWVAEKAREWGTDSPLYLARVLGQFPPAGDDQLISLKWVEDAVSRAAAPSEGAGRRRMGVDIARFGDDATVYVIVDGDRTTEVIAESRRDTMHVVGRIIRLRDDYGVHDIALDDAGVGGGVTDRLIELGVAVAPVNGGASAIEPERFVNRRAELWWTLREWIRTQAALPDHRRLIEDLTAPRFGYTSRGQIRLESKEETKKRLGRSPDYGDALALSLAARTAANLDSFGDLDWGGGPPLARRFPD